MERKVRSFKIIYVNANGEEQQMNNGRYCGSKPKQAACKALTGIFKDLKNSGKNIGDVGIKFCIKETTRGSNNKKFWYNGRREELENPVEISLGNDKRITYKYVNTLEKIPPCELNADEQ